ncbi:MAG TPA: nucleotidyltransferase family protein [Puia sp.]|nr:nucleotidyltransferase family protein [Puia sp.]
MNAMIFAAGLGTRFKPWTDSHPKALAVVNGKTLLERNLRYLQQYGIREVIVNIHHFADQIVEAVRENKGWGSSVSFSREIPEVLETGGGLKKAGWYFDKDPFVVMNVDILTDLDLGLMKAFHEQHRPLATLATTTRKTSRYLLFDDLDELCGWKNVDTGEVKISRQKSSLVERAFSGIHIIDPRIFTLLRQNGKFSIIDSYLDLAQSETIKGFDHSRSRLIDVGRPESLIEAELLFP